MAQRYDNEAQKGRLAKAKKKVHELVKKGYRLNPDKASSTYHQARIKSEVSPAKKAKAMTDWQNAVGKRGW